MKCLIYFDLGRAHVSPHPALYVDVNEYLTVCVDADVEKVCESAIAMCAHSALRAALLPQCPWDPSVSLLLIHQA